MGVKYHSHFDGIPSLAMPTQIVVAAAVISCSRVLVAQRVRPPELAGRWELPGGKVAPGETEPDALARELAEELGKRIAVLRQMNVLMQTRAPSPTQGTPAAATGVTPA